MSGITKCINHSCELKEKCWRYLAPADPYRQSYSQFQPKHGKCEYFITNEKEKNG